jgi:hypothetical protein
MFLTQSLESTENNSIGKNRASQEYAAKLVQSFKAEIGNETG